jgi:RNA polymerase sigma factor (TIGR02999 family)
MAEVTQWLQALDAGDPQAAEELLPLIYDELRRLAAAKMASQPPGQTLQATALVHEAWLRLCGEQHTWQGRRHFFAAAAEAMRRILVDQARRKQSLKQGGAVDHVPLDGIDVATESPPADLLRIHDALDRLAALDPVKAELVKLRYFAGLRIPEAAEVLGISATTAKRHWTFARAWLRAELKRDGGG